MSKMKVDQAVMYKESTSINNFMTVAVTEAEKAAAKGECPVGAVIVQAGKIIGRGHNLRESENNALLHAEIAAIDEACKSVGSWRLNGCNIYVTLEPCIMCAGAIINSRIEKLYFGAYDLKAGAAGGLLDVFDTKGLNHRVEVYGGIMEHECGNLLTQFFKQLRRE